MKEVAGRLVVAAISMTVALTALTLPAGAVEAGPVDGPAERALPALPEEVAALGVVEEPVPLDRSPVSSVDAAGGVVVLGYGEGDVAVDLPVGGGAADGPGLRSVDEDFGVAVVPTLEGVQLVVSVDDAGSPESYDFGVDLPSGFAPELTEDGAVALRDADGAQLGYIEQPWAFDADGAPVATRFEVEGSVVRQVVEHVGEGVAYPITADPKIKGCNWQTATCITFSKSETRTIASHSSKAGGIGALCGLLPHALIKVGCSIAFVPVWASLKGTFDKAERQGKCVEVKLNRLPPATHLPIGWKVVKC